MHFIRQGFLGLSCYSIGGRYKICRNLSQLHCQNSRWFFSQNFTKNLTVNYMYSFGCKMAWFPKPASCLTSSEFMCSNIMRFLCTILVIEKAMETNQPFLNIGSSWWSSTQNWVSSPDNIIPCIWLLFSWTIRKTIFDSRNLTCKRVQKWNSIIPNRALQISCILRPVFFVWFFNDFLVHNFGTKSLLFMDCLLHSSCFKFQPKNLWEKQALFCQTKEGSISY